MPVIQIHMKQGRTDDQKRQLVRKITDAVVETINADPKKVSIIISEMTSNNFGNNGILLIDKVNK